MFKGSEESNLKRFDLQSNCKPFAPPLFFLVKYCYSYVMLYVGLVT